MNTTRDRGNERVLAMLKRLRDGRLSAKGSCRRCRWKTGRHNPNALCGRAAYALMVRDASQL